MNKVARAYVAVEPDLTALRDGLMAAARAIDGISHPDGRDEAVGNIVHVSREDWDDMSDAMDKLRTERDRLAEGLRCMTVERDFWRKRCRSQDETIGGLADKLADEGMA